MVHGLKKSKSHHTLLIGLGPHAKKVYVSWFLRNGRSKNADLSGIVELAQKHTETDAFIKKHNLDVELIDAPDFIGDDLPISFKRKLTHFVRNQLVDSVIIATEPSVHKAYALWALEEGLSILMDKPVTARPGASTKLPAARALLKDYDEILIKYNHARKKKPELLFSISAQRRYHVGFELIKTNLIDVLSKTDCPVTSIQSSHGDGQWRLPEELINLDYHGYKNGYGKMSHSGYHFFDLFSEIIKNGVSDQKKPTHADVYTQLVTPRDQLKRMRVKEHANLFANYTLQLSQQDIEEKTHDFGEIDAFCLITFRKNRDTLCAAQLSLQHSNFSVRSWLLPKSDLYKGNGRVKHEHHTISQGPFQTIQLHSYQVNPEPAVDPSADYELGGRNHLEIHIFRNKAMIGGKSIERISVNDLIPNPQDLDLLTEVVKAEMIHEFFDYLNGNLSRELLKSDLPSHRNTVALMSAAYISSISGNKGNPVSSIKWS